MTRFIPVDMHKDAVYFLAFVGDVGDDGCVAASVDEGAQRAVVGLHDVAEVELVADWVQDEAACDGAYVLTIFKEACRWWDRRVDAAWCMQGAQLAQS